MRFYPKITFTTDLTCILYIYIQGRIQRGATVAQAPVRFSKLKILIYAASALRDFCIFNRVFQGDAPAILIAQLDALDNKVQNNLIT